MVMAVSAIDATGSASRVAAAGPVQTSSVAPAGDFAAVLGSLVTDTADKLRTSETVSAAGIQGRASTQAVVEAIMEAERSLQTTLAVRDKVVAAYQEISRMAI